MPKKEWVATGGFKIRLTNTCTRGAKLYFDGDCRDTNRGYLVAVRDFPVPTLR
jgi:hypothetical protein